jgi:tetratricopeptide (TPR) repeat protein
MLREPDSSAEERAERSQIHYIDPIEDVAAVAPPPKAAVPKPATKVAPPPPEPMIEIEIDPEPVAAPPPPTPPPKAAAKPKPKAAAVVDRYAAELEEAQFFAQQGLVDEAREVIAEVLARQPDHAAAQALIAQLGAAPAPSKAAPKPASKPAVPAAVTRPPQASPAKAAHFEVHEPARVSEPLSDHEMEREMERSESNAGEDFFDLAGELKEEIDRINRPSKGEESEPLGFEEVFAAFEKGVKQTVSEDETEAHYNLGIAYKEMGLLDDAIAEFRLALKDIRLSVDAAVLIGLCYRDSQRYTEAEQSLRKALDALAPADERVLNVKYEMAEVMAIGDKLKESLAVFKEVYAANQAFRDVSHRIKAVAEQLEGKVDESGEISGAKSKSKISYL